MKRLSKKELKKQILEKMKNSVIRRDRRDEYPIFGFDIATVAAFVADPDSIYADYFDGGANELPDPTDLPIDVKQRLDKYDSRSNAQYLKEKYGVSVTEDDAARYTEEFLNQVESVVPYLLKGKSEELADYLKNEAPKKANQIITMSRTKDNPAEYLKAELDKLTHKLEISKALEEITPNKIAKARTSLLITLIKQYLNEQDIKHAAPEIQPAKDQTTEPKLRKRGRPRKYSEAKNRLIIRAFEGELAKPKKEKLTVIYQRLSRDFYCSISHVRKVLGRKSS